MILVTGQPWPRTWVVATVLVVVVVVAMVAAAAKL